MPPITRRDFLSGCALSLAAGTALSPLELLAMTERIAVESMANYYPPALMGMRGDHPGSFETAHAVGRRGKTWPRPSLQQDDTYDLVVVGGGISGLAAAWFYQQRAGAEVRILVLDNHDDFGGHCKRNEFDVDGKRMIGYGGCQSIDTPGQYSTVSAQFLKDIGIEVDRFYQYYDHDYYSSRKLKRGLFFNADGWGKDVLADDVIGRRGRTQDPDGLAAAIDTYPVSDEAKHALLRLLGQEKDYLAGKTRDEKIALLRRTSYTDFIQQYASVPKQATDVFRDNITGLWGVGWDALSALEGYRLGNPGMQHLDIGELTVAAPGSDEPYIFHFPDGNAGITAALVRKLIPAAVPGNFMEDLVLSRVNYALLDQATSGVRIRLNSTGVDIRHTRDKRAVDVTYVRQGKAQRVRGKHVIYAGYNAMLPKFCPEVPAVQRQALTYPVKVPLTYITVALRNWRAFSKLGYHAISIPKAPLMQSFGMDFPVSMGGYEFAQGPDDAMLIHGTYVPTLPDQGLSAREQHEKGRRKLLELTFADFENDILRQMGGALGAGGFDAERDIAGITVNRWPHGYAYEYNEYSDPEGWGPEEGPHIAGRAQIGRISIANADASGYAYVNGAVDAANRAVNEQLG